MHVLFYIALHYSSMYFLNMVQFVKKTDHKRLRFCPRVPQGNYEDGYIGFSLSIYLVYLSDRSGKKASW